MPVDFLAEEQKQRYYQPRYQNAPLGLRVLFRSSIPQKP